MAEEHYRKHGTCFDETGLRKLAEAWNASPGGRGRPIKGGLRAAALRAELQERLAGVCGAGEGADACWAGTLGADKEAGVGERLRKEKPADWAAKPNKWLNNFDIDAVMRQYEGAPAFRYAFLGVHPVDFAEGWAPDMTALRLADLVAQGKRACGFIVNLDRHDQPGSHWTCVFAVLDPKLPSYGAYYYDSVAYAWPKEVRAYMGTWQAQMRALYPRRPFPLAYNRVRHQFQNTECGMFAMFHQILWIERLKQDAEGGVKAAEGAEGAKAVKATQRVMESREPTTFDMIVAVPVRDKHVWNLRDMLYRGPEAPART